MSEGQDARFAYGNLFLRPTAALGHGRLPFPSHAQGRTDQFGGSGKKNTKWVLSSNEGMGETGAVHMGLILKEERKVPGMHSNGLTRSLGVNLCRNVTVL